MNNIKLRNIILVFSTVFLLVFSSIGSVVISKDVVNEKKTIKESNTISIKTIKSSSNSIKIAGTSSFSEEITPLAGPNYQRSGNIVISNNSGNESFPSGVLDGLSSLVAYEFDEQESDPTDWLYYDNGTSYKGLNITNLSWTKFAIRLTPTELLSYKGYDISTVRFYHNTTNQTFHNGYVEIFGNGTSTSPGTLLSTQYFNVSGEGWKNVTLDDLVSIDSSEEYWISINVTMDGNDTDYPIELDTQSLVAGKGGWINNGSGWIEIKNYIEPYDNNFMIRAGILSQVKESYVCLRNSKDYGQNWSVQKRLIANINDPPLTDIETITPNTCLRPNSKRAYVSFISPVLNSSVYGYAEINNIDNLNGGIETGAINWDFADFYNFSGSDIVPNNHKLAKWVIGFIGSTENIKGPAKDTVIFGYRDKDKSSLFYINWDSAINNCSNLTIDSDIDSEKIYGVCEIQNGSNTDGLFINATYDVEDNNISRDYWAFPIDGSYNFTNPQIFVKEDQVYVSAVIQSGSPSFINKVMLFNSTDGGRNWSVNEITNSSILQPENPTLYVNDTHILCAFNENGNIYLTNSEDYGGNWTLPVKLNDVDNSVVQKFRFSQIVDKDHVIWVDERENDYDIYSILLTIPIVDLKILPNSVKIIKGGSLMEGYFIPTKNRLLFSVKNVGKIEIDEFDVEIHVEFDESLNKEPLKIIGTITNHNLEPDANTSHDLQMFRLNLMKFVEALFGFTGMNGINITVDPGNKLPDENRDDNTYKLDVLHKDIFQLFFLGIFESLVKRF